MNRLDHLLLYHIGKADYINTIVKDQFALMTVELMSPSKTPTTASPHNKGDQPQTEAEKRQDRLAQALRANLRRRKAQKRGRADGDNTASPETPSAISKGGNDHG